LTGDHREAVGLGIRERPQQHAIDHGVNRGVGADAQPERQNGSERESGILQEDANGVSEVSHNATLDEINDSNIGDGVGD
jgi:hypothetical protein